MLGLLLAIQASVTGLPPGARNYVDRLDRTCREAGGTPSPSPKLVHAVDLNGDSRLDHVIDVGQYQCADAYSIFSSGHDGAPVAILIAQVRGRATVAYEGTSHGVSIGTERPFPRVHLVVGALACGQPPNPDRPFSDWWFCSRPLDWHEPTQSFRFAPVSEAKRIH